MECMGMHMASMTSGERLVKLIMVDESTLDCECVSRWAGVGELGRVLEKHGGLYAQRLTPMGKEGFDKVESQTRSPVKNGALGLLVPAIRPCV